jgi:hypothetical protein
MVPVWAGDVYGPFFLSIIQRYAALLRIQDFFFILFNSGCCCEDSNGAGLPPRASQRISERDMWVWDCTCLYRFSFNSQNQLITETVFSTSPSIRIDFMFIKSTYIIIWILDVKSFTSVKNHNYIGWYSNLSLAALWHLCCRLQSWEVCGIQTLFFLWVLLLSHLACQL